MMETKLDRFIRMRGLNKTENMRNIKVSPKILITNNRKDGKNSIHHLLFKGVPSEE